jgi:glycerophosphoryl diester phosphodiesterase
MWPRWLLSNLDGGLAPAPDPARVAWLRGRIYAHRGLHDEGCTENSPSAFRAAVDAGLGIECDIQRSLDDWPMVFHDWDLARLLGRPDEAESVAAADWRALRDVNGEPPLTLSDLLELVAGKVPLLVEIKSRAGYDVEWSCRRVADALRDYEGHHAVMSFDPRVSSWLRRHSPGTVRGLVVTEENARTLAGALRRHRWLWRARPDFLAYDVRDLPSRFAAARRRRGLPLLTWTVRTPALRKRAAEHADAPIAEGEGVADLARSI